MTPVFQTKDGRATVYQCKAQELLATLPDDSVDFIFADPPYAKRTHDKARGNKKNKKGGEKLVDFEHISPEDLRAVFDECGRVMKRWLVSTMDYHHAIEIENNPPKHMRVPRLGVWVKTNPAPQITGDRPAQGWEAIVYAHKLKRKMTWAGGGRSGVFIHNVVSRAQYKTQKPLPLLREFIELFSDPGDLVLDPFAGGGTTAVAAFERGRCVITCDPSPKSIAVVVERLSEIERRGAILPGTETAPRRSRKVKVEQGQLFT